MPRQRWKLTQAVIGHPVLDEFGDLEILGPEPKSLLAELALDPANGLERIAPGVYHCRKGSAEYGPSTTA